MYNVNLAGKIQTVNGLIEPENLGITLTHEHLFCDQSGFSSVPTEANKKSIFFDKVSQENLGYNKCIYCKPGVRLDVDNKDIYDQQYSGITEGIDFYIVGRGITLSDNPGLTAEHYRKVLWDSC